MHRQAIHRGRVAYEPNSLAGGCPFQAGARRASSRFRAPVQRGQGARQAGEVRRPLHAGARCSTRARPPSSRRTSSARFRFELSKVTVPAIRERMVASLRNASRGAGGEGRRRARHGAARRHAEGAAQPGHARGDALAGAVADGAAGRRRRAHAQGRDPRRRRRRRCVRSPRCRRRCSMPAPCRASSASRLGSVQTSDGEPIAGGRLDGELAAGAVRRAGAARWRGRRRRRSQADGHTMEFITNQYRHCKTILALGASKTLLDAAGVAPTLPRARPTPACCWRRRPPPSRPRRRSSRPSASTGTTNANATRRRSEWRGGAARAPARLSQGRPPGAKRSSSGSRSGP